ncbi:N-acetyltransferase family protein [Endozoicomonas atrinae]|uniref:GNAT family N-acetyltransferase n=1 Tax=Endozoicomonas atrinae TaxID=1333660 RepID=UPI003B00C7FD
MLLTGYAACFSLQTPEMIITLEQDLQFIIDGIKETHIIEEWPEEPLICDHYKDEVIDSIARKEIRVVEEKDQRAGFVWVKPEFRAMHLDRNDYLWIYLMFVKKEYRRSGVGKVLDEEASEIARKLGRKEIIGDIFEVNHISRDFYKKLGAEPIYTIYSKKI